MDTNPFKVTESVCIILFSIEIVSKISCQPMQGGSYSGGVALWFQQGMNWIDLAGLYSCCIQSTHSSNAPGLKP
jgi:hypothetical protein